MPAPVDSIVQQILASARLNLANIRDDVPIAGSVVVRARIKASRKRFGCGDSHTRIGTNLG
jgi:hypothetical protein